MPNYSCGDAWKYMSGVATAVANPVAALHLRRGTSAMKRVTSNQQLAQGATEAPKAIQADAHMYLLYSDASAWGVYL